MIFLWAEKHSAPSFFNEDCRASSVLHGAVRGAHSLMSHEGHMMRSFSLIGAAYRV